MFLGAKDRGKVVKPGKTSGVGTLLERGAEVKEVQQGPHARGSGLLAKSGVQKACRLAH